MNVRHECPQCGGPVTLDETDRLFTCTFCKVRLFISSKDYFRYYLTSASPLPEETIFIPYWRFRGILFSLRSSAIKSKVLEKSFIAIDYRSLPLSLGLRAQALPLRFATPKMKSRFMVPQIKFRDVLPRIYKLEHGSSGHAYIGDTTSLIYSPVYVKKGVLYDGILRRPVKDRESIMSEEFKPLERGLKKKIHFDPALCPDCGWDLYGERNSVVLLCKSCNTAWTAAGSGFRKLHLGVIQWKGDHDIYVPFWRQTVNIEGLELKSYGDLIRFCNMPKVVTKQHHEQKLHFWSPAFTGHPMVFQRLATHLTAYQPSEELSAELPKAHLMPVTLDASEASESVMITLFDLAFSKENIMHRLHDIKIKQEESTLVYFPFKTQGTEYIQPRMNFSIQRNAIRGI